MEILASCIRPFVSSQDAVEYLTGSGLPVCWFVPQMINDTAGKVSAARRGQELHDQLKTLSNVPPQYKSDPFSATKGSWKHFVFICYTLWIPHLGLSLDSAASGFRWMDGGGRKKTRPHSSHLSWREVKHTFTPSHLQGCLSERLSEESAAPEVNCSLCLLDVT